MATNQGLRQASVRAVTGTTLDYNGDWHALFDLAGIHAGSFNGRMLAWINQELGTSYPDLPGAMQGYAKAQGYLSWDAMGTFTPGGGGGGGSGIVGVGAVSKSIVGSGSGETQSVTLAIPAEAQAGDLLLACLSTASVPSTVEAGWSLLANRDHFGNVGAAIYSRVMVGGDTDPTFATVSGVDVGGGDALVGAIIAVRGLTTVDATDLGLDNAGTAMQGNAMTATADALRIDVFGWGRNASLATASVEAGYTEQVDDSEAAANFTGLQVTAADALAPAGAVAAPVSTLTVAGDWACVGILLR